LSDLPHVAAECIRVTFRTGILAEEIAQKIEPDDLSTGSESWAMLVVGLTEAEVSDELEQFNTITVSLFHDILHRLIHDRGKIN